MNHSASDKEARVRRRGGEREEEARVRRRGERERGGGRSFKSHSHMRKRGCNEAGFAGGSVQ